MKTHIYHIVLFVFGLHFSVINLLRRQIKSVCRVFDSQNLCGWCLGESPWEEENTAMHSGVSCGIQETGGSSESWWICVELSMSMMTYHFCPQTAILKHTGWPIAVKRITVNNTLLLMFSENNSNFCIQIYEMKFLKNKLFCVCFNPLVKGWWNTHSCCQ